MSKSPYQALVDAASPDGVLPGFADVVASASAGSLVASENVFVGRSPSGSQRQQERDAPAYFAGASLVHVEDGWAYLGRSLGALLHGDRGAATHLAYYAELRAALGLLAGQGMLAGNYKGWAVQSNGALRKRKLPTGTHVATWQIFDRWSQRQGARSIVGQAITPLGEPLEDWLTAAVTAGIIGSPLATARQLLARWSLDLQQLSADRDARNLFSYQPTGLQARPEFAPEPYVCELWSHLNPQGIDPFEQLDRFLLRDSIDAGLRALPSDSRREEAIDLMLNIVGPQVGGRAMLLREGPFERDPAIIKFSRAQSGPWSVIARATILLRVATGSARWLMDQAGVTGADLREWGERVVEEAGLPLQSISAFVDLWPDVEDSITYLGSMPSLFDERSEAMLRRLEGCERVTAWALAS